MKLKTAKRRTFAREPRQRKGRTFDAFFLALLRGAILPAILVSFSAGSAAAQTTVSGFVKGFALAYQAEEYGGSDSPGPWRLVEDAVWRARLFSRFSSVSVEAAYQLSPFFSDGYFDTPRNVLLLAAPRTPDYRLWDIHNDIYRPPDGHFRLYQNLDRLNISVTTGVADITIGRQAIAFGSARFINPTDVIAPFSYYELNREERRGVDALRAKIPLGNLGLVDAGLILGNGGDRRNSALFVRPRFNVRQTDVVLTLMDFSDNLMFGADFSRSIGGAGVWLEAAHTLAGWSGERKTKNDYFRLSAGANYNFFNRLLGIVEYHYNGAGESDAARFQRNLLKTAYNSGGVYLMGRQYLAPGAVYEFTPLLHGTLQGLVNLGDPSLLVAPKLNYDLRQDLSLEAGGFLTVGPSLQGVRFQSEFGTYPQMLYLTLRMYY